MVSKLDVKPVVSGFLRSLTRANPDGTPGRPRMRDYAVMFGLPVGAAVTVVWLGLNPRSTLTLLTVLALLAGFLFNVLIGSIAWIVREQERGLYGLDVDDLREIRSRRRLLQQLHSTVAYGVLTALLGVAVALPVTMTEPIPLWQWRVWAFAGATAIAVHLGLVMVLAVVRVAAIARVEPVQPMDTPSIPDKIVVEDLSGGRIEIQNIGPARKLRAIVVDEE